ncbi:MAG: SDR family NAD(P)-dependent oxidoreductase [Paraglaciecola sp.]|nr:SDR family NAD(P)-dependent oxidoreductase [Paraglaciecola sp.]
MNLSSFSLDNKRALVTGASRGLGQAIALGLAKAGADVICASSSPDGCAETMAMITALGGKATQLSADLSHEKEVQDLANQALALSGGIDILVNNGGTIFRQAAVEYSLDEWRRVMQVNLDSAFMLSQVIGRSMIANRAGKIINIASMLSFSGGMTVPAYTASKHAIAGLTKALANEWAQFNIQVNAIAPGYFKTDNTSALQKNAQRNAEITQRIPAEGPTGF